MGSDGLWVAQGALGPIGWIRTDSWEEATFEPGLEAGIGRSMHRLVKRIKLVQ